MRKYNYSEMGAIWCDHAREIVENGVFIAMMAAIGIYGNITGLCIVFLSKAPAAVRLSGAASKTCGGTYTGLCIYVDVLLLFRVAGKMLMLFF